MRWILVSLSAAVLLFARPALAQDSQQVPISELNITVNLQTDGTAVINQDIFYLGASPLNWTLFESTSGLQVTADNQSTQGTLRIKSVGQSTVLSSSQIKTHWQISYKTSGVLIRHDNRDQFYLKLFQSPNVEIFDTTTIFTLPGNINDSALTGNIYAIGGIQNAVTTKTDNNTLKFTSSYAGVQSLFTVSASWPKGIISYNWLTNFKLSLLNLNLVPWLVIGILFPVASLFVLIDLVHKRRKNEVAVTAVLNKLPSNLSPILVGVLVNKKIKTEEIVALIVDLCQRGYLVIVKKGNTFSLGKRKAFDNNLQAWEQEILAELFATGSFEISTNDDYTQTVLFSQNVIGAFNKIYEVITSLQFFTQNPHFTRVRYKLVGITTYIIGALGLIAVTVFNSPNYLLIPFAAMMVIAFLITKFSPKLVEYSAEGYAKRAQWLAFGNFLKQDRQLSWEAYEHHAFETYLPYAIVLGVTKEWAKRFDDSNLVIVKPDWFVNEGDISVSELTKGLIEFTSAIAKNLARLKGPTVS